MINKTRLKDIFLNMFHTALLCLLSVLWVVDVSFVLIVVLDVLQMDDHVQGVSQDEQQDEGGDEAHEDGWRQESSAVTCRRKFTGSDIEGLNLKKGTDTFGVTFRVVGEIVFVCIQHYLL